MKTSNYFILLMMASAIVGACSKQETSDLQETKKQGVLSASISQPADEDATKTSLNGELDVVWSDDDAIAVFADGATTLVKYTSDNTGTGTTKATFTGDAGTYAYAYYPYKGANSVDGSNKISVVIPRVQTYAANTFGQFDMPMLATIAADKLNFTNLMAVLKLQLTGTGTVSRIIVMSKTQKLSGKAVVATDGSITFDATDGMSYNWVELDCGAGVALSSGEATPFLIAVPAGDYAFTVRVVSTESKVASDKSVASAKTFTANKIKKMASYAVAFGGTVKYVDGAYVGDPVVIKSKIDGEYYTWAPVNVGYDASYTYGKYGKVFQAGRKYGQRVGITIIPTTEDRDAAAGSDIFNEFKFYSASFAEGASWLVSAVPQYYNAGKTEYDPCPVGWRAPSFDELKKLMGYVNASSSYHNGRSSSTRHDKVDGVWGFYFDGGQTTNDPVSGVYLPVAGMRTRQTGASNNLGQNGAIMMGCNRITPPSWGMIQSQTASSDAGVTYNETLSAFTGQTVAQAFSIRCIKE